MAADVPCQAYRLSEVLGLIDGSISEAGGLTCAEPSAHLVHIRRPGWVLQVVVCDAHRVVISIGTVGYVSSS